MEIKKKSSFENSKIFIFLSCFFVPSFFLTILSLVLILLMFNRTCCAKSCHGKLARFRSEKLYKFYEIIARRERPRVLPRHPPSDVQVRLRLLDDDWKASKYNISGCWQLVIVCQIWGKRDWMSLCLLGSCTLNAPWMRYWSIILFKLQHHLSDLTCCLSWVLIHIVIGFWYGQQIKVVKYHPIYLWIHLSTS